MTVVPSFNRGADVAEALSESSRGTRFPRTHYLGSSLAKKGDTVVVRFLGEENGSSGWITVGMHVMAPTRPAPPGYTGKWPEKMDATCRKDKQMAPFGYPDCYICDNYKDNFDKSKNAKPAYRTWTLCVVREEVVVNGMRVGYKDATREEIEMGPEGKAIIDPATGKAKVEVVPDVRVVTFGYDPFFKVLKGHSIAYGTLLDRDYFIARGERMVGSNKAADYTLSPLDRTNMVPGDASTPIWDLRPAALQAIGASLGAAPEASMLEMLYPNLPDIAGLLVERSADEYFHRFFDLRFAQPVRKSDTEGDGHTGEGASGGAPAAPAQPDVAPDAMEAMRARLAQAQPMAYPQATPPA